MITLIIVDCQNDFISGTMAVKSAKQVLINIKDFIKNHKFEIENIVFTCDWHPFNHCSFKSQGGQWPSHCVQFTPGACIEPKLLKYVQSFNIPYQVSLKGYEKDEEQYGAFTDIYKCKDYFGSRLYLDAQNYINPDSEIVVCGIAGDYCVKETISNLLGKVNPKVFMEGIASIDDGTTINNFVKERELCLIS